MGGVGVCAHVRPDAGDRRPARRRRRPAAHDADRIDRFRRGLGGRRLRAHTSGGCGRPTRARCRGRPAHPAELGHHPGAVLWTRAGPGLRRVRFRRGGFLGHRADSRGPDHRAVRRATRLALHLPHQPPDRCGRAVLHRPARARPPARTTGQAGGSRHRRRPAAGTDDVGRALSLDRGHRGRGAVAPAPAACARVCFPVRAPGTVGHSTRAGASARSAVAQGDQGILKPAC